MTKKYLRESIGLTAGVGEANSFNPRLRQLSELSRCERYESLIQELETRTPTREDFKRLAQHESDCPTGKHTEAGVEAALGLPPGALRYGSQEHELLSPQQLLSHLIGEAPTETTVASPGPSASLADDDLASRKEVSEMHTLSTTDPTNAIKQRKIFAYRRCRICGALYRSQYPHFCCGWR